MHDQRIGGGRTKTALRGRIAMDDGAAKIDCVVKDMSDGGAKLEVADDHDVAAVFDLEIPELGVSYRSELRWRYARTVGVKFMAPDRKPPGEDHPTRAELIAENACLRETVRALAQRLTQLGEPLMLPPIKP